MYISILLIVPPLCLVLAALTDFLEMTIPNRIPIVLIAAFVAIAPLSGLGLLELGWHLLAAAVVFSACFALFAINVMGGGDAKLLTGAALWFGFNHSLFEFLVFTGYIGGLLTLVIILMRANWDVFATVGVKLPMSFMTGSKVPYGIAIGAGGLIAYPNSPLMVAAIGSMH